MDEKDLQHSGAAPEGPEAAAAAEDAVTAPEAEPGAGETGEATADSETPDRVTTGSGAEEASAETAAPEPDAAALEVPAEDIAAESAADNELEFSQEPAAEAAPVAEAEPPVEPKPASEMESPAEDAAATDAEPATEPEMLDEVAADQLLAEETPTAAESEDASLKALLEAVIYVTDEPLTPLQIAKALDKPTDKIRKLLAELVEDYTDPSRGILIREVAGGYTMGTKPEHHEDVRKFVKTVRNTLKLSPAALETLACIAYKQPITAPEIQEIRGVQGTGVLKTLLDRKLITTAGRKNVIGKPILYKTTKDFLKEFGLKDLNELPTLKEFEELSRIALADAEVESPAQMALSDMPPDQAAAAATMDAEASEQPEKPENAGENTVPEASAEGAEPAATSETSEAPAESAESAQAATEEQAATPESVEAEPQPEPEPPQVADEAAESDAAPEPEPESKREPGASEPGEN